MLRSYREISTQADRASPVVVLRFFGPEDFETRLQSVERIELEEGARFEVRGQDHLEWCLIALEGGLRLEARDESLDIGERSLALCPAGVGYALSNRARKRVEVLLAAVRTIGESSGEVLPSPTNTIKREFLDRTLLAPFAAHLGLGEIDFRTIFDHTSTSWSSIDHLVLPPGTSVGHHRNHNAEEVFVVIAGSGRMMIEHDTIEIASGDCIANPLEGAHGVINHTNEQLEILNLSVLSGTDEPEVTDLGDDLSSLA